MAVQDHEKISSVLFKISSAIDRILDLNELFNEIHHLVKTVVNAKNFFIALHNHADETTRFTYYVDEISPGIPGQGFPIHLWEGSLTLAVIETGNLLVLKKEDIKTHYRENKFHRELPICEVWIGVPLKIKNTILGVMAVQSYTDPNCYSEQDIDFLLSVSTQLALAVERQSINEQIRFRDDKYQSLIENINDAIYSTDSFGRISYITPAVEAITGYASKELNGKFRWYSSDRQDLWSNILIHPDDRTRVANLVKASLTSKSPFSVEYRVLKKNGQTKWISEKGQFYGEDGSNTRLDGIITDIQEQKQAEQINKALFSISNAVNTTLDLDELYKKIHESLGHIINVDNFYIALYDKNKDIISFPFIYDAIDEYDGAALENASKNGSLTAHLIREGKSALLDKQKQIQIVKDFGDHFYGTPSELWLGVPLRVKQEVIGAMVVQSYTDSELYGEKEVAILASVSDQVAIAIERKQSEETLRTREQLITSLYNITNSIHTTSNLEQLYESIHESLKAIADVNNFTIGMYSHERDELLFIYTTDKTVLDYNVPIKNASRSTSLTYEVIRTGQALLLDEKGQYDLAGKKGGMILGTPAKSWLGVPLIGKNKVLGAIIIQNYDDENCYKKKDVDLLTAVSSQIAFAIEHKKAESDLAETQKQLIDKAHQAGMADIATDTLHNVGNLLNSIQTSSFLASEILKKTHVEGFRQANEVLKQQMDNLEEFFVKGDKGKKLLEYYLLMEESFSGEQKEMLHHLERLNSKIQTVSDVISTQQNYAGIDFLSVEYPLPEIVEDALIMMEGILESNSIRVTKEFQEIPVIKLQKNKLVHILINLIKNASDSLVEKGAEDKEIVLTIDSHKSKVVLKVKDNGNGISKNNLRKIFHHGFTTKKRGYGFGLHSCANYMSEMDGRIWAESDGSGAGATLILEFPVVIPR